MNNLEQFRLWYSTDSIISRVVILGVIIIGIATLLKSVKFIFTDFKKFNVVAPFLILMLAVLGVARFNQYVGSLSSAQIEKPRSPNGTNGLFESSRPVGGSNFRIEEYSYPIGPEPQITSNAYRSPTYQGGSAVGGSNFRIEGYSYPIGPEPQITSNVYRSPTYQGGSAGSDVY